MHFLQPEPIFTRQGHRASGFWRRLEKKLVDVGIVPEALVDIFPSAPEKSSATKRSTSKGARLITADTKQPSTSTVNKPDASKQTSTSQRKCL